MEESAVDQYVSTMLDAHYIAVDTESTGKDGIRNGSDYLMGISVAYRVGNLGVFSAYFPFRHPYDPRNENLDRSVLEKLRAVFDRVPLVFHNLKFDLHSLATIGIEPKANCYDTMLLAHMLNEELPSKSLEWLSGQYLSDGKARSEEFTGFVKAFGWTKVPPFLMDEYARHDAVLTLGLFELFWPKMREQQLAGLWPHESHFTRLLRKVERRGVRVDPDFCAQKSAIGRSRMDAIADELGFEVSRTSLLADYLLNELKLPVLKISPKTNKPLFDKKVMEEYDDLLEASDRPDARLILEYRGWQKAVTSLYEPIVNKVDANGRVHPDFRIHGTKTGRLSCREPNLQQIPRKSSKPWNGDAKRAFVPDDGFELWEFDYSQLEYRLACEYSGESELITTFNEDKVDIFTKGAIDVFGSGDSSFRNTFKTHSYATLYGAGVPKIAQTLGISIERAEAIKRAVDAQYPNLSRAAKIAERRARDRGYIRYWTGRRRHFRNGEGSHKAWNSLLQGGGAELVKRAMLRLDDEIDSDRARMVLQVHDAVVFEIHRSAVDDTVPVVVKLMTDFPEFTVRLKVAAHRWGE